MAAAEEKDLPCSTASFHDNVATEGRLTRHYEKAITKTLDKFISTNKFELLKKRYPEIFENNPEFLKDLYDQMCSQLRSGIQTDSAEVEEKMNIYPLLLSLDKEVEENRNKNVYDWRPSGDPKKDFRAHSYVMKSNYITELKSKLFALQLENDDLRNVMAMKHAEIMRIKKENDEIHRKFSEVVNEFNGEEFPAIEKSVREFYYEKYRKGK